MNLVVGRKKYLYVKWSCFLSTVFEWLKYRFNRHMFKLIQFVWACVCFILIRKKNEKRRNISERGCGGWRNAGKLYCAMWKKLPWTIFFNRLTIHAVSPKHSIPCAWTWIHMHPDTWCLVFTENVCLCVCFKSAGKIHSNSDHQSGDIGDQKGQLFTDNVLQDMRFNVKTNSLTIFSFFKFFHIFCNGPFSNEFVASFKNEKKRFHCEFLN